MQGVRELEGMTQGLVPSPNPQAEQLSNDQFRLYKSNIMEPSMGFTFVIKTPERPRQEDPEFRPAWVT